MVKMLRSFIQEKFPLDLRVKFDILSRRRDIIDEKGEEILKLLREFNVGDVTELGPGTNRYAFRLDGFVVKVATDADGKIDNLKEFKMAKRLYPYVAKTYEVLENGILLVAEYIPPFSSYSEMLVYADAIRSILTKLSSVYLIGDVGISSKNFGNWGVRTGTNNPVCLDFAYVYEVSSSLFICRKCKANAMLVPNSDFTTLHCSNKGCGIETSFEDIRGMIGNDLHRHEIGDLKEEGYEMKSAYEEKELTVSRSNYLAKRKKRKLSASVDNKNNEEDQRIKFIMEHDPDYYINKEENKMSLLSEAKVAARATVPEGYTPNKIIVNATARPAEEVKAASDDLAFSATIDNNTRSGDNGVKVLKVAPVEKESVEEKKVEEATSNKNTPETNVKVEKAVVTSKKVVPEKPVVKHENHFASNDKNRPRELTDEFITKMYRALSKLAMRIQSEIWHRAVFDEVKNYCKDRNMYPQTFYQNVQNAVFRSIASFLEFIESTEPNTNKPGKHKIFVAPDNIRESEHINTVIFIERLWNEKRVSTIDNATECINAYHEIFDDCLGIEREWIPFLKERIRQKMNIDNVGIDLLADKIAEVWCVPEEDEEPEETVERVVGSDEAYVEKLIHEDEQSVEAVKEAVIVEGEQVEEEVAFGGIVEVEKSLSREDEINESDDNQAGDEENEDDYEEDDYDEDEEDSGMFISVQIIMNEDGYDIIRLNTGEPYGAISIPFYTSFDNIDLEKDRVTSIADPRNGMWDWLIHTVPDNMFTTKDPDKYLRVNDVIESDDQLHIVILDKDSEGIYTMGIYYVTGIYVYDDDDNPHRAIDPEFLEKLNIIITRNIGFSDISHLKRSLSNNELIRDEEYINLYLENNFYDDDPDDEQKEGEQVEEEVAVEMTEGEQEEQRMISAEEVAAINAIMNGSAIPVDNDKKQPVSGVNKKSNDDDLFTPVKRKKAGQ